MKSNRWVTSALPAIFVAIGICRADPPSEQTAAGLREGAAIDSECLKKNILKEVVACRAAATGVKREPSVMLGLYFHMWFSDVVLSQVYRDRNAAELSGTFERLADAEFPGVLENEEALHVEPAELCRIIQVNCANAVSFHNRWQERVSK